MTSDYNDYQLHFYKVRTKSQNTHVPRRVQCNWPPPALFAISTTDFYFRFI